MPTSAEIRNELDNLHRRLEDLNEPPLDDEFKRQLNGFEQKRVQLENESNDVNSPLEILQLELAIANLQKDLFDFEIKKAEREVDIRAFKLSQPYYAPVHAKSDEIKRIYDRVARRHNMTNEKSNEEAIQERMRFYEGMQVKRKAKKAAALATRIESSDPIKAIMKQRELELRNIENAFSTQRAESARLENLINTISEQIMAERRRAQEQTLEDPNKVVELANELFSQWKNIHVLPLKQQDDFIKKVEGLSRAVQNIQDQTVLNDLVTLFNDTKSAIEGEIRLQAYLVEEDVDENYNPKTLEEILESSNPTIKPYSTLWKIVANTQVTAQSDLELTASSSATSETASSLQASSSATATTDDHEPTVTAPTVTTPTVTTPTVTTPTVTTPTVTTQTVTTPTVTTPTVTTPTVTFPTVTQTTTVPEQSRARLITPLQEIGKLGDSSKSVKNLKDKFERIIEEKKIDAEKSTPRTTTRPPRKT